ncbi:Pex19 protein family-domain-containing protein [Panaeolus papilionaceus]|nr:Pex19 protein family-domain-containing protein [Panaeolus papilionaceus]
MSSSTQPTTEKKLASVEDDLDDLDDVLDQFTPTEKEGPHLSDVPLSPVSPVPNTTFGRPRHNTTVDKPPISIPSSTSASKLDPTDEIDEDYFAAEFAKNLQEGMEDLMLKLAGEAQETAGEGDEKTPLSAEQQQKLMKAAWEAMLIEGLNSDGKGLEGLGEVMEEALGDKKDKQKTPMGPEAPPLPAGDFQTRIKQTMEKLKQSESKLKDASGAGTSGDPSMADLDNLMKTLGDLGLDGDDPEFGGFLEGLMGQLLTKEVLYEPLKELSTSFPGYLEKNAATLSQEDKTRYEQQRVCVAKILAVFDRPSYTDTNAGASKEIMDLMSEMQTYGSPPAEIMGDLPPGFDGSMPNLNDENCVIC